MDWYVIPIMVGMFLFFFCVWPALASFVETLHERHNQQWLALNCPELPSPLQLLLRGGGRMSNTQTDDLKTVLLYVANGRYRELKDRRLTIRGNWIRVLIIAAFGILCTPLLLVFSLFGDS